MTLEFCAALVQRGDPDRFLACMAAPVPARAPLFALAAFNLEVARVPLLATTPEIAAIRLAWWRRMLDELAAGAVLPDHEVLVPLALALPRDRGLEAALGDLVAARELDLEAAPFAGPAGLWDYLDRTAGTLLWAGAAALGAPCGDEAAIRALGRAQGLANWLLAVPALTVQGRVPLPPGTPVAALARSALAGLRPLPRARARNPALLAAWRTRSLLHEALHHPQRVAAGELGRSELGRRLRLLWQAAAGWR